VPPSPAIAPAPQLLLPRRHVLAGLGAGALGSLGGPLLAAGRPIAPRQRVIIDNDFAGDPDGLFQLAHHLASPSVEIPLIVGSHLHKGEFFDPSARQADHAAQKAATIAGLMRLARVPRIIAGANAAMAADAPTPASAAIIAEALRDDTQLPLFYAAGASLTELATAWLAEPRIGRRLVLVWIGGPEHADLLPGLPQRHDAEYNLTIDTAAAEVIFNRSDIEIWQVPRNVYRQMLVSRAELAAALAPARALGRYLLAAIEHVAALTEAAPYHVNIGETYILGDSPLVTLTALQSSFEPDSASSLYTWRPTPRIGADGAWQPAPTNARPMRVYEHIDTRLTFADMFAKLAAAAR